jgi:hypothetical protein
LSTRQKEIVGSFSKNNPAKNEENGAMVIFRKSNHIKRLK